MIEHCGTSRSRICLFPAFSELAPFAALLPRLAFYLTPVLDAVSTIDVAAPASWINCASSDDALDPAIQSREPSLRRVLQFVPANPTTAAALLTDSDVVLVWNRESEAEARRLARGAVFVIDPRERTEGDSWIEAGAALAPTLPEQRDRNAVRLHSILARLPAERCYIFGTGPSLSSAATRLFDDGVSIVCNSIVRNAKLLDLIQPKLIVAADPIFHAGCSRYAADFRHELADALRRTGAHLVIQERDAHIYRSYLPQDLEDRILALPVSNRVYPTLDLSKTFSTAATKNVFTMFLLPLGFSLAKETYVFGCDGRPISENSWFWKHDPASQFTELISNIQSVHPGFFVLSYDAYYALHCETVRQWILRAERAGKRIINLTPSHIPALKSRSAPGVYRPPPEAGEAIFALRARAQFARRRLQLLYGTLLSRTSGRPRIHALVRLPVRATRRLALAIGLRRGTNA